MPTIIDYYSSRWLPYLIIAGVLMLPQSHTWRMECHAQEAEQCLVLVETVHYEEEIIHSSDPEAFLGNTGVIAVGRGRVFVWDRANYNIKVFTHDLTHIQTLGRLGQGPGEFSQRIRQLLPFNGGVIAVDPGNLRITVFAEDGSFLYSVPAGPNNLHRSPFPLALDQEGNQGYSLYRDTTVGDGLIASMRFGQSTLAYEGVLTGRVLYEDYVDVGAFGDDGLSVFMLGNDSLLLLNTVMRTPDASSLKAFMYRISEQRLSSPISLLPRRIRVMMDADYQHAFRQNELRRRARGTGFAGTTFGGIRPLGGVLFQNEYRIVFAVSAGGERHGIMVDMLTEEVTDLGILELPPGLLHYGAFGDLLYITGVTDNGPFITGYRVQLQP